MKALVVDDDNINRRIHCKLLQNLGVEFEEVRNGKEAIDIHSSGKKFDLILMDLDMPILNGIQATKQLRAMGISSIIAGVSTHSMEEQVQVQEFVKSGLNDYQQKPLTTAKLIDILRKINPHL
ncbi:two-component response regulator 24 [Euphorbia lathyris]|uniref:two-component response regulator 24 n=1 Tax=Euphorbia lathyris TaxID=212925 RepID=UPI003313814A